MVWNLLTTIFGRAPAKPQADFLAIRRAMLNDADIDDLNDRFYIPNIPVMEAIWPDGAEKIVKNDPRNPRATRDWVARLIGADPRYRSWVYTGDSGETEVWIATYNHGTVEELLFWLSLNDADPDVRRTRFRRGVLPLMYEWMKDAQARRVVNLAGRYPVNGTQSATAFLDEIEATSASLRNKGVPSRDIVFPHIHEGMRRDNPWREYRGKTENIIRIFELGFWRNLGLPDPNPASDTTKV